ncbi:hypothetical protein [[Eubacterium] hominis]
MARGKRKTKTPNFYKNANGYGSEYKFSDSQRRLSPISKGICECFSK